MEEIVRQHFLTTKIDRIEDEEKDAITKDVISSDDVIFQWCLATGTKVGDAESCALLQKVIALYITVRGFAFAKSCLELYKQATKKALAKSKGLRKELFTTNVKDN